MAHREIAREGYAYVAVSRNRWVSRAARASSAPTCHSKPKNQNAIRVYSHPGDTFAYDIFSQAGRLVRNGGDRLDSDPKVVLAVGSRNQRRI